MMVENPMTELNQQEGGENFRGVRSQENVEQQPAKPELDKVTLANLNLRLELRESLMEKRTNDFFKNCLGLDLQDLRSRFPDLADYLEKESRILAAVAHGVEVYEEEGKEGKKLRVMLRELGKPGVIVDVPEEIKKINELANSFMDDAVEMAIENYVRRENEGEPERVIQTRIDQMRKAFKTQLMIDAMRRNWMITIAEYFCENFENFDNERRRKAITILRNNILSFVSGSDLEDFRSYVERTRAPATLPEATLPEATPARTGEAEVQAAPAEAVVKAGVPEEALLTEKTEGTEEEEGTETEAEGEPEISLFRSIDEIRNGREKLIKEINEISDKLDEKILRELINNPHVDRLIRRFLELLSDKYQRDEFLAERSFNDLKAMHDFLWKFKETLEESFASKEEIEESYAPTPTAPAAETPTAPAAETPTAPAAETPTAPAAEQQQAQSRERKIGKRILNFLKEYGGFVAGIIAGGMLAWSIYLLLGLPSELMFKAVGKINEKFGFGQRK